MERPVISCCFSPSLHLFAKSHLREMLWNGINPRAIDWLSFFCQELFKEDCLLTDWRCALSGDGIINGAGGQYSLTLSVLRCQQGPVMISSSVSSHHFGLVRWHCIRVAVFVCVHVCVCVSVAVCELSKLKYTMWHNSRSIANLLFIGCQSCLSSWLHAPWQLHNKSEHSSQCRPDESSISGNTWSRREWGMCYWWVSQTRHFVQHWGMTEKSSEAQIPSAQEILSPFPISCKFPPPDTIYQRCSQRNNFCDFTPFNHVQNA